MGGLIGTAPPVCFAVFGIVTPILERRFGLERLAAASMLIVTSALIARSLAGSRPPLATTVLFAAVGGQRRPAAADQDVLPRSPAR
jgi:CP family cyanate transporter-like MFS transporter